MRRRVALAHKEEHSAQHGGNWRLAAAAREQERARRRSLLGGRSQSRRRNLIQGTKV